MHESNEGGKWGVGMGGGGGGGSWLVGVGGRKL